MPSIWDQYGQARPMAAVRKRQGVRTSVQRPVQNETSYPDYLMHYGILGQRWGVRRYQNKDGTLTEEGRKRYMMYTNVNHGRKMSLVGRLKFGKEVTAKTEEDEENRAKASIAEQKRAAERNDEAVFNDFKKDIKEIGVKNWVRKTVGEGGDRKYFDRVSDYIIEKKSDLLDEWWDRKEKLMASGKSLEEQNKVQEKYARRLCRELGIPESGDAVNLMMDWFITWDD